MMQKFIFLLAIYVSFSQIQFCKGSNNSFDISIRESFEFAPITPSPENTNKETPYLTPIGQRSSDWHDHECIGFYIWENLDSSEDPIFKNGNPKFAPKICDSETSKDEDSKEKSNNTISSDDDIAGTRPAVSPRHFQEGFYISTTVTEIPQKHENIPEKPIDTCWTSFRKKIKLLLHLKS